MKQPTQNAWKLITAVMSMFLMTALSAFAQGELKVAVMPSYTQNQTYANAGVGEPIAVWGRVWGGTAPYTYTLERGDGSTISGSVSDPRFIGGDHTYTSSGSKTMKLTVTDSTGASASRSATVRVFLAPDQDTRVNMAISRGLVWLYRDANYSYTNSTVSWRSQSGNYEYARGTIAFAVLSFEENGHKPANDPEADIYADLVSKGINTLLYSGGFRTQHGSGYFSDHHDGVAHRNVDYLNDNGYGAVLFNSHHAVYINGIAGLALALATNDADEAKATIIASGPFAGMSHYELMQDLTEQFSYCQGDGGVRGGWEYNMLYRSAGRRDGSSQQWPCLFMKGAMDVHGIEPADWVKEGIDISFRALQNGNGAIGYASNVQWLNSGKTGGALVAWNVAGKDADYNSVQKAVGYLGARYYHQGGWSPPEGWAGYSYAMYGMKKGLALMGIDTIQTSRGPRNWYSDMSAWLLGETPDATHAAINPSYRNQNYMFGQFADGRWRGNEFNIGDTYTTANAVLILTKAVTVPLPVAIIDEFADADSADPEEDGSSDNYDEVKAGANVTVSGGSSFHQGAPDFVINQYQWILRPDNGSGSPVGALDWSSPDFTGVNIVLDRDPADAAVDGLQPGVYHLTLRVRDDADEPAYSLVTKVFEAVNKNFPPVAVPIPAGQIAYTGEFVPGNSVQVTLNGTDSYDPEGDEVVSYAWDLDGDGVFNDPDDQAMADDATSPMPTLTFDAAANIEVGLKVCSQDEFGVIKCSTNQARIQVFVTELDLFVDSIAASDIVQGVSADVSVAFGSDLDAPLSGVQVQFYDGLPPVFGGGGVALGGVFTVDFADDGSGAYVASLDVDDLPLNGDTEEVYVFIDSNTAVPEYAETVESNVAVANVSNQAPVAVAQDVTLSVGAECTATAVAAQFDGGSTDADGDALVFTIDQTGPWEPGTYTITLSVSDGKVTATDTAVLTVIDNTAPVITLNGGDLVLECGIDSYDELGAVASDNCDPNVVVVIGGDTVDATAGGTYVVTYDAVDIHGNAAAQVVRTITVQDTTPPVVVSCPADLTLECPESPLFGEPVFSDACDHELEVVASEEVLPVAGLEVHKVVKTWVATDDVGLSVSCSQTITVLDTIAPTVVSCPADLVIECPESPVFGEPEFADACDHALTVSHEDTSLEVSGKEVSKTMRTWTATDSVGHTVSCSQTITVQDTTAPVIAPSASDMVVECDGAGNLAEIEAWLLGNGGASATDACSEVTWDNDFAGLTGDCGGAGSAAVTFTATDAHGNSATTVATFTIVDTTAPVIEFVRAGGIVEGVIQVAPNEVPLVVAALSTDTCSEVSTEIAVTCHAINGAGKLVDKTEDCDIQVSGHDIVISESGGVGAIITITAVAEDGCGNTTESVLVIEVINPGKKGPRDDNGNGNGKGKGSSANEGVGNGVDGNTPGHDHNGGNDDPGTGPGKPGARNISKR